MNKDKAIITQVAAKIAADLIVKSENVEATCADWELAFNYVNDKLQLATGINEHTNMAYAMSALSGTIENDGEQFSAPRISAGSKGSLQIAGKQHGDLPGWLIAACQKAGVGKVWDNRDTAVGTRRPWFKQADAPEGAEPAAFWPPKGN